MTITKNRRGRWTFALLLAAVAALTLAALQDSDASGATATASGTTSVDINHFAFHPPTLHIHKNGKVAFANSSSVTHTATRAGSFDTGRIKPGTTKVVQFNQKGTFAYHCKIHTFMHGKIVVE
ncbi:MAG TPA: cupredoxin domain-containing protein [Solirubrobacterales bacterium]|nr:cupredoxin domain-containing protein [Solirubrobacterales bacterium]